MLSDHPIKPKDVIYAFCIPVTRSDYECASINHEGGDFIRSCTTSYAKYKFEIIDNLREQRNVSLGVKVVDRVTLTKFKSLFDEKRPLIILVAHSKDGESIEFFDQVVDKEEMLRCIPLSFNGVIDLCVCSPIGVAEYIDLRRPNCFVRYTQAKSSIMMWMNFYNVFFDFIAVANLNYYKAFEKIALEILKQKSHE